MQRRVIKHKYVTPMILEEAWNKLASNNYVDDSLLRQDVAISWKRCLDYSVNPIKIDDCSIVIDFIESDKKTRTLSVASDHHIQQLYDAVKGNGYVIILTDANGIILNIIGDKKVLNFAESLKLVPGANCSEDAIGTNSMGTCVILKRPLQIFSHEHYCQYYHDWSCSSAPILDCCGNLVGTLDISNTDNKPHPHLLHDLVKMTARAIGMNWDLCALQDDAKNKYYYFNAAIDSVPDSLIFLDNQNNISHINKNALKILGNAAINYIGQGIQVIAPEHEKIKQALADGQAWTNLHFNTPQGLTSASVRINPIKNICLKQIGAICSIKEKGQNLNNRNVTRYTFDDFVCTNTKMQSLLQHARKISATDVSILIQGESGTGKEILAQAVHNNSARCYKPFVAVNCAALPTELIQSELFGYEEGSFTGAKRGGKAGKFELAQGGTLFLDEIGDMPLAAQANLLRVLQEKYITRLGGQAPVPVDVRIIAATNKNLPQEIEQLRFRADLFYRLASERLHVPPLRERKEDIWPIIWYILKKHLPKTAIDALHFAHQVKAIMEMHEWPGNVRELENVVLFFLNTMHDSIVTVNDLPTDLQPQIDTADAVDLKQMEQHTIKSTLAKHGNNISTSAKALGISRNTLYRKIKRFQRTED
uniref:Transcriptional activator of acetoin/glycerol metabolism n=1 Tax=Desulfovibrio sp. U5L TaxID=596152 RepID=I2Q006_9BACT